MASKTEVSVGRTPEPTTERFAAPPVDIYDGNEELVVVADVPGVERDGLDVTVDGGMLRITARQKQAEAADHLYEEFRLNHFYREFTLGEDLDHSRIAAELKNGVLTVKLPRAERAKPKRIPVAG